MLVLPSKHIPKSITSLHSHCFLLHSRYHHFLPELLQVIAHLPLHTYHFTLFTPSPRDLSESVVPVLRIPWELLNSLTLKDEVLTKYKALNIDTLSSIYSVTDILASLFIILQSTSKLPSQNVCPFCFLCLEQLSLSSLG